MNDIQEFIRKAVNVIHLGARLMMEGYQSLLQRPNDAPTYPHIHTGKETLRWQHLRPLAQPLGHLGS